MWTQKVYQHSVSKMMKVNRFRLDKREKKKEKGEVFCGQFEEEMVKHS